MSKIGRNKKWCENYKKSTRKADNKELKKLRLEKLLARFAKRKAEGKGYEWEPNPFEKGTYEYRCVKRERAKKNVDRRLPLQKWTSEMRKLQNEIAKREAFEKQKEKNKKYKKVVANA